jgi:hypothetical protein
MILPVGYQRWKFIITTAAMKVLPVPVGRHTSVLCWKQTLEISSW